MANPVVQGLVNFWGTFFFAISAVLCYGAVEITGVQQKKYNGHFQLLQPINILYNRFLMYFAMGSTGVAVGAYRVMSITPNNYVPLICWATVVVATVAVWSVTPADSDSKKKR